MLNPQFNTSYSRVEESNGRIGRIAGAPEENSDKTKLNQNDYENDSTNNIESAFDNMGSTRRDISYFELDINKVERKKSQKDSGYENWCCPNFCDCLNFWDNDFCSINNCVRHSNDASRPTGICCCEGCAVDLTVCHCNDLFSRLFNSDCLTNCKCDTPCECECPKCDCHCECPTCDCDCNFDCNC